MQPSTRVAIWLPIVVVLLNLPAAEAETLDGTVMATRVMRHGVDVITRHEVVTDDGARRSVVQFGGRLGDRFTLYPHAPALAFPGQRVRIDTDQHRVLEVLPSLLAEQALFAFVPQRTARGLTLRWSQSCIPISLQTDSSMGLAPDEVENAMIASFQAWIRAGSECSRARFVYEPVTNLQPADDGINLVRVVSDVWGPPDCGVEIPCYSDSQRAISRVTADANSGTILDVDIDINNVNFTVTLGFEADPSSCSAFLENTLTHEVGHLLGFGHTCWDPALEAERGLDSEGRERQMCTGPLPTSLREATMYPYQQCNETMRATLEPDDELAICSTYPRSEEATSCDSYLPESYCSSSGASASPLWLLVFGGVLRRITRAR